MRRVEEMSTVSVSQNDQHQQLQKMNQLNRNNSQHKGIEILGRRNHLNAEVYASQSNLISKQKSQAPQSRGSAHRYQSVGVMNL